MTNNIRISNGQITDPHFAKIFELPKAVMILNGLVFRWFKTSLIFIWMLGLKWSHNQEAVKIIWIPNKSYNKYLFALSISTKLDHVFAVITLAAVLGLASLTDVATDTTDSHLVVLATTCSCLGNLKQKSQNMLTTVGARIPNKFGIRMVHSCSVQAPTIRKPN